MIEINSLPDIKVLYKALYCFKFGADEDVILEIVRSPFFGDLFRKIAIEYSERTSDLQYASKVDYSKEWNLETRTYGENEIILNYLKEIDGWSEIDISKKRTIVNMIVSPFFASESYINALIERVDEYWNDQRTDIMI